MLEMYISKPHLRCAESKALGRSQKSAFLSGLHVILMQASLRTSSIRRKTKPLTPVLPYPHGYSSTPPAAPAHTPMVTQVLLQLDSP